MLYYAGTVVNPINAVILEKAVELQLGDLSSAFKSDYGMRMIHPLGELPLLEVSRGANRWRKI